MQVLINRKSRETIRYFPAFYSLVVIFQTKMRYQIFALQMPQSIFEFHQLDKNIVFGIKSGRGLRSFEIERKPFLNSLHSGALSQIHKQSQIQNERRG